MPLRRSLAKGDVSFPGNRIALIGYCLILCVAFFFIPTFSLPSDDKGALCEEIDRLCGSHVTYEMQRRGMPDSMFCRPFHGQLRCVSQYYGNLVLYVEVNRGCKGGDCIRAISPTAQNRR